MSRFSSLPTLAELQETARACAKGTPRIVVEMKKDRDAAKQERECRRKVDARDHRRCRYPTCRATAVHKHHIVYRSRGGKWDTTTIVSLCVMHHRLIHAGLIAVTGNADKQLHWTEKAA